MQSSQTELQPNALASPQVHSRIERPELGARLDAAVRGALTLVVAPPGAGKSILVAQWARSHVDRVAWFELHSDESLRSVVDLVSAIELGRLDAADGLALSSARSCSRW